MTAPAIKLDTAAEAARWFRVSPRQIRKWAVRGHITRYPGDQYNLVEIADWYDTRRDTRMDDVRRGLTLRDRRGTLRPRDASPETG